jgi:transcriptional regulator with XRE-family HTH domain
MTMETRLSKFMTANGITDKQLAIYAGIGKSTVQSIREGRSYPRLPTLVWITGAAAHLARRQVKARELFDLGDGE